MRGLSWWPVLVPPAVGLAVMQVGLALADPPGAPALVRLLRMVALLPAVGLAFVLDDPSHPTVEPAPVSLLRRRAARVALAGAVLVGWWSAVLLSVRLWLPDTRWPVAALTLEVVTMAAAGCAAAAIAGRRAAERRGAVIAAPVVLALAGTATVLPAPVALLVEPGDPAWVAAHGRWLGVLGLAVLCFLVMSRDPARR
ncbi:hypothetical protein R8Z50_20555 [Longispora sp. K20-0274]|uniref:hypothetical protein n=1 Tax=Longispora sp. K20-0274 TaxID=3088255 RepID=UPI00399A3BBD